MGAVDGSSRMYLSGRNDTRSREYSSGHCCNKTPETPDIGDDEEDKDDEEELDKLGQRNQKKGKRWIEKNQKNSRKKKGHVISIFVTVRQC